jgi:cytochrome c-type biogenesis protein CcmH
MQSALLLFAPAAVLACLAAWWIARAIARAEPGVKPAPVLLGCLAALAGALGLYLFLGRPNLPDAPFAQRLSLLELRAEAAPDTLKIDEVLAILEARAKNNPNDPRPHLFAAQLLDGAGRDIEADREYRAALKRAPDLPTALIGLGRVRVRLDGGVVSPASMAIFKRAAELAPKEPAPWLYQAMAATQGGQPSEAAALWREVQKRLAPDDPRRAMVETMIKDGQKRDGAQKRNGQAQSPQQR